VDVVSIGQVIKYLVILDSNCFGETQVLNIHVSLQHKRNIITLVQRSFFAEKLAVCTHRNKSGLALAGACLEERNFNNFNVIAVVLPEYAPEAISIGRM